MNHKTESGEYEVLYPETLSTITYITDNLEFVLGLEPNSTVDDAIMSLALPSGRSLYELTLKASNGRPLSGITISGLTDRSGRT